MTTHVLMLGRQGAGKGLVGRLMARDLGAEFLSMGDILRAEQRRRTPLGRAIGRRIDVGDPVPADMSYGLMSRVLAERASDGALVLDGVPNRGEETGRVSKLLGAEPSAAILLDLPTVIAVDRLRRRRTCSVCDWPHGSGWPAISDRCTECGAELLARPDDAPAKIEHRHKLWGIEAHHIVRHYEDLGILRTIPAHLDVREVVRRALDAVG
jgi:adenylate kinase